MTEPAINHVLVVCLSVTGSSRNMLTADLLQLSSSSCLVQCDNDDDDDDDEKKREWSKLHWPLATDWQHFQRFIFSSTILTHEQEKGLQMTNDQLKKSPSFPRAWNDWEKWLEKQKQSTDTNVLLVVHGLQYGLFALHNMVERWRSQMGECLVDIFRRLGIVKSLDTRPWLHVRFSQHSGFDVDSLYSVYRSVLRSYYRSERERKAEEQDEEKDEDEEDDTDDEEMGVEQLSAQDGPFESDAHCLLRILQCTSSWHEKVASNVKDLLRDVQIKSDQWQTSQGNELKPRCGIEGEKIRLGGGDGSSNSSIGDSTAIAVEKKVEKKHLLVPLHPLPHLIPATPSTRKTEKIKVEKCAKCQVPISHYLGHVCLLQTRTTT